MNFEFVSNFDIRASNLNSSHLAYVIYTSGSTGKPKGVLTTHANVTRVVKNTNYIDIKTGDRILQLSNYAFDGSVFDIYGALLNGAELVMINKDEILEMRRFSEVIKRQGITVFFITTALFNTLVDMEISCFKRLRKVLFGGERVSVEHAAKALAYMGKARIIHVYGPTETTVYASYYFIDSIDETSGTIPIGKPISNTTVYILDKYLNPVPMGVPGEIYIGGAGVARGYLNNPELTADRFKRNVISQWLLVISNNGNSLNSPNDQCPMTNDYFYSTGDLARWLPAGPPAWGDSGGVIEFIGRIDHQVKIRGFRVEPGEIEQRLREHRNIKEVVVEVKEEKNGEKYLCAYYTSLSPAKENLKEFLAGKLPPYMIPQYFVPLEKMPLNINGKIDRKQLPEPDISSIRQDSDGLYVEPKEELEQRIAMVWQEILKIKQIGIHDNFFDLGGNSLKIIQVHARLNETLGLKIPVVNLFKYPTIHSLKEYLNPPKAVKQVKEKEEVTPKLSFTDGFAVIGMAGRFPGAENINRYWENVINGIESITFFTDEELAAEGVSPELLKDPAYVKGGGILKDKDRFDAAFFNYTPQEARIMDPQVRIFHECTWEAMEDAGYSPEDCDQPVGLYAGAPYNIAWEAKVKLFAGNDIMNGLETFQLVNSHFIPTRISYKLNLKGPAVFIQTACSTSLLSIHTACNALLAGDCTMALAGGVSLSVTKKGGYLYQESLILSPDGHCRAFDAGAGGTVGGEGAAVVLVKPLQHAIADHDHIYAVIKASATNNDGSRKVGFSAPSIDGQAEAIAAVYRKAGIPAESITYIETHGTGTTLGDPIELAALKQAFNTAKKGFCALGSVKSNVGHMDSASGAAGFIKAVLALKHRKIPPTLHFEIPNTQLDLIDSPFFVNTTLKSWDTGDYPLRAGVSSFGIGGTNAHIILEEYINEREMPLSIKENSMAIYLILISAKTPTALTKMKENLRDYLLINKDIPLACIAYTLQYGRKLFTHKWMALCSTIDEIITALASPGNAEIPNWQEYYEKETHYRVPLPAYPFAVDGQPYWIDGDPFNIENPQQRSPGKETAKKQDIADWFYLPRWTQSTLPPLPPLPTLPQVKQIPLRFLVFADNSPLVLQLIKNLANYGTGQKVITVTAGKTFTQTGDSEFIINPQNIDDYDSLLTNLNQRGMFPQRIVHCWNVAIGDETLPGPGFYSLFYLTKAISRQNFGGGNIAVDIITANAQEVTGNETLIPANALVLGPIKVIPQEYPYITCRAIDIEMPIPGNSREEILAGYLANELFANIDTDIAYRNHYRWIKNYEPIRIEAPVEETLPLRKQGVYLITGGIGDIGITLAQYLIEHFRARVILTGISPLPPRQEWNQWLNSHDQEERTSLKITKIRRLEAIGDKRNVLFFTVDVGDKKAMAEVIAHAEETFGPIHGVIHAAGVVRDQSLLCAVGETGENEWNRQFRPKVLGTLVLAELFQTKPLDFCLLTSSLSPILGGLGFAAYAAANAFMDAFAYQANRANRAKHPGSTCWLSVNWADWGFRKEEVGTELKQVMGASAKELIITPEEGVETFKRVLTLIHTPAPAAQAAISSGDLQNRIERWIKLDSLHIRDSYKAQVPEDSGLKFQDRPRLSSPYAAPQSNIEHVIARAWQNQFGINSIGINDDFFELGGDSLKAISMISKIHKELNARVQLNDFFSRPTVKTLAQFITGTESSGFTSIQPTEKKEYYPLSPAQKRLYLLDRMGAVGLGYNLPLSVELLGNLDEKRLGNTFVSLIKRHETFRTSFHMIDDQPVQRIYDEVKFEIEYLATEDTEDTEGTEKKIKHFIRAFDLTQAPLLRVGLLKKEADRHLLLIDMHHIISDGVSHLILVKEFTALYENQTLPELHLQYKDYAEWQYSIPCRQAIKKQEGYWLHEWEGETPVLDIPFDYPRPVVQGFAGGAVDGEITALETMALNEMVRLQGATVFMGLLAAYAIFLAKISNGEDIPIGCPVAGRGHADMEQIIGMFVNTLALRNPVHPEQTFLQFLLEIKEKTLAAFENQDYPFEELVEKVVVERDMSRNPLFDVMFVLQNVSRPQDEMSLTNEPKSQAKDLRMTLLPKVITASQFDLVLEAIETGPTIRFFLEYCSQLFQRETIVRFVGYFKQVIASIIKNPLIKISDIEIMSEAEKRQVLVDFNNTDFAYPHDKTVQQLFTGQAAQTPDYVAVFGHGRLRRTRTNTDNNNNDHVETLRATSLQVTYFELNRQADR
ncbi:MAG: SDR family oxidoreductase, partial [Acidobacteria bacterium]|nr:SDR family oxidoreductase [Acidobacteriota bacterium]